MYKEKVVPIGILFQQQKHAHMKIYIQNLYFLFLPVACVGTEPADSEGSL